MKIKRGKFMEPYCRDARECKFRNDKGKCKILTSVYPDEECKFRKSKEKEPRDGSGNEAPA